MSASIPSDLARVPWQPQPKAWAWVLKKVDEACAANEFLDDLRGRLHAQTGTRLVDWLDHLALPARDISDGRLRALGYAHSADRQAWIHEGGLFPPVVRPGNDGFVKTRGIGIKVEKVTDFLEANGRSGRDEVLGEFGAAIRVGQADRAGDWTVLAVERHGDAGWTVPPFTASTAPGGHKHWKVFTNRSRPLVADSLTFAELRNDFARVADDMGRDAACDLFFATERAYWQSRNRAAQVQYHRQQRVGMGWANHDHHTYRCSRVYFASLIATFEQMGFVCRERFYAGAEAGWGAQVLEHPVCGIVIFADVDLSPGEITGDFPHEGLAPRRELGTVGLWCMLHGEAFFSAGMHHLECQFDFQTVRRQLALEGVKTMAPFTDFPYLRQAFTEAEVWEVPGDHLQQLVDDRWITKEQAAQFGQQGARGSHLEILERNDGYKGFNQTGISEIIARTDPRRADL